MREDSGPNCNTAPNLPCSFQQIVFSSLNLFGTRVFWLILGPAFYIQTQIFMELVVSFRSNRRLISDPIHALVCCTSTVVSLFMAGVPLIPEPGGKIRHWPFASIWLVWNAVPQNFIVIIIPHHSPIVVEMATLDILRYLDKLPQTRIRTVPSSHSSHVRCRIMWCQRLLTRIMLLS